MTPTVKLAGLLGRQEALPLSVEEALLTRRSVRAFLPDPVPRETIEHLLALASRAPSGSNIQPWQVIVLSGDPLLRLTRDLQAMALAGEKEEREFQYYPQVWRHPYLSRRRKVGWALYGSLGIARGEKERMAAQHARNMLFFDAPVGLLFTMDADLEIGSWLDLGMFLQSIMLAARSIGLDSCPQVSLAQFPKTIRARLGIPEDRLLICGMALGKRCPSSPENLFVTEREPVSAFARFVED